MTTSVLAITNVPWRY